MVDAPKVGDEVRFREEHRRGIVLEIDRQLFVARLELSTGGEKWERLEELEVVEPWDTRRRIVA